MAELPGYGKLLTCPYNKSHQILPHRMQVHLIRCRKQNPVDDFVCPFNTTHRVPKAEKNHHIKNCPDRVSFEMFMHGDATPALPQKMEPQKVELVGGEEWSDDECGTYDPQKFCEENDVLRSTKGLPPSQRKAFRQAEKARLNALRDETSKRCDH